MTICVAFNRLTRKTSLSLLLSSSVKKKKKNKKKGLVKGVDDELHLTPRILLLQCYVDLCKALSWVRVILFYNEYVQCFLDMFFLMDIK